MKKTVSEKNMPPKRRSTDLTGPIEMRRSTDTPVGGVSVRVLNRLFIVLAVLAAMFLLVATWRVTEGYQDLQAATNQYMDWQQDAENMKTGSDYLTEQARGFAATGDPEYLRQYFYEVDVTRRRDRALERLEQTSSYQALQLAMKTSVELMEREYYSMRLTVEANGVPLSTIPAVLQNLQLDPADEALSPDEKNHLALSMLYDETYQTQKETINENVMLCISQLMDDLTTNQANAFDRLLSLMHQQQALIFLLLIAILCIVVLTARLVIRPLRKGVDLIRVQSLIPMEGSSEFRFLARTYNTMFEENRRSKEKLVYDASHDPLTGLFNRSAYERLFHNIDESSIALLLIDVDKFKGINDTYGHETGDRVLTRVAAILSSSFRVEDYVCRIGGDEFAVIMANVNSGLKEMVREKVRLANDTLQQPLEGVPSVTLSVGVAFGDRNNPTDSIFKDADAALYQVKRAGRNGCAFYE